jgi:hypothetical protein
VNAGAPRPLPDEVPMDAQLHSLLAQAFERAPASEATARLAAARERLATSGPMRSYEVVLAPDADFRRFADQVVPRMVYHFESLGIRPPEGSGAFVSFFVGEELHLVHLRDVFAFACRELAVSPDELLRRFGTGERRAAIRDEEPASPAHPTALLGPGHPE